MYQHHNTYKPSPGVYKDHLLKPAESPGIGKPHFIWDRKRKQLIVIMETRPLAGRDLSVTLKGYTLMLEAPIISSYNKPLRMHLIEQEIRNELEEGLTVMGKSEFNLDHGYHYHLISFHAIDPELIKIVLGYTVRGANRNLNKN